MREGKAKKDKRKGEERKEHERYLEETKDR